MVNLTLTLGWKGAQCEAVVPDSSPAIKTVAVANIRIQSKKGKSLDELHGREGISEGQRFLVTGSAGFIGSNLSRTLLDFGASVLGVDNLSSPSPLHAELLDRESYTFLEGDVTSSLRQESWPSDFAANNLNGIFHLASPASPTDYGAHQIATLRAGALAQNQY